MTTLGLANWKEIFVDDFQIAVISLAEKEANTILNFVAIYSAVFLHELFHSFGFLNEQRINEAVKRVNWCLK